MNVDVEPLPTAASAKRQKKRLPKTDKASWGQPISQSSQIFQLVTDNTLADPGPSSSMAMLENASSSAKERAFSGRAADTSAVAGASILASMSNLRTLLPPPLTSIIDIFFMKSVTVPQ